MRKSEIDMVARIVTMGSASYSKKDLSEALDDLHRIFEACKAYLGVLGIDPA